jgi:DNA-binding NarL/FixJ family response regulator
MPGPAYESSVCLILFESSEGNHPMSSPISVLVIEDFEPVRNLICTKLKTDPRLEVVGQVSDGVEGVKKAQELQPHLILLDIGLPRLNGLEAARRICKVSPSSKIVFVTQESSTETIEEALRLGAKGYIVKTDVGRELLPGVAAVLDGRIFLSSHPAHSSGSIVGVVQPSRRSNPHVLAVYRDDAALVDGLVSSINRALYTGRAVISVVTESHRQSLLRILRASNIEVDADVEEGRLVFVDVAEACVTFAAGGQLDAKLAVIRDLIGKAAAMAKAESPKVFICGECPSVLLAQGKVEDAIELERFWEDISKVDGEVVVHCAYRSDHFEPRDAGEIFESISAQHTAVLGC